MEHGLTSITYPWERRLLALALGPLQRDDPPVSIQVGPTALEWAYDTCAAITREHSKTFYLASGLLPPAKRQAARALYAFCRVSDDLVDRAGGDPLASLEAWRQRALVAPPAADDPVPLAWADTRARYRIPVEYAQQLLDGVARDLCVARYPTFDDLVAYAYGVASTVGLMTMHIIGFVGQEAVRYAVKLGVALQLTNILRDIGEDWAAGRLYLPQDELAAFGVREADIAAGRLTPGWQALMRFQIQRARQLYAEALPGIALLHQDGRLAIQAAAELYQAILDDIEAHNWDVFSRRAHISAWGKLRRLPGIWRRARRARL